MCWADAISAAVSGPTNPTTSDAGRSPRSARDYLRVAGGQPHELFCQRAMRGARNGSTRTDHPKLRDRSTKASPELTCLHHRSHRRRSPKHEQDPECRPGEFEGRDIQQKLRLQAVFQPDARRAHTTAAISPISRTKGHTRGTIDPCRVNASCQKLCRICGFITGCPYSPLRLQGNEFSTQMAPVEQPLDNSSPLSPFSLI